MIDLDGQIEVFMITNGRSTFRYCHESVMRQQGVGFKSTIMRDKPWLEANRTILDLCTSKYFVRVDDDFILHPLCIAFMWNCIRDQHRKIAMRQWRLWEPYSNKVCKGVKVYNLKLARKVGYRVNDLGKIDKMFTKDARGRGLRVEADDDVVAIHSCSTVEEHMKYAYMRGENKGQNFKSDKKFIQKSVGSCSLNLDQQKELLGDFLLNINQKRKTGFYAFIKQHNLR